jgi:NAD(P)-dependent dehydrogenase (short-subunit alcohol dehydrogenase family)
LRKAASHSRAASLKAKFGIRVNAIAPVALTRMTEDLPLAQNEAFKERMHPRHIAPLIVYLASDLAKDVTRKIFFVGGGQISEMRMVRTQGATKKEGVWTPDEIARDRHDPRVSSS